MMDRGAGAALIHINTARGTAGAGRILGIKVPLRGAAAVA
jgi:hypothetical protein